MIDRDLKIHFFEDGKHDNKASSYLSSAFSSIMCLWASTCWSHAGQHHARSEMIDRDLKTHFSEDVKHNNEASRYRILSVV